MNASQWSVEWWKGRHDQVYFPAMEWHRDWKICPYPPPHVVELLKPTRDDYALEIGCGYGEWMVPFSPHVGRLAGIDLHDTLAVKAAEKFAENGASNCEFRLTDGLSIAYPADTFTIVYSISVFQHIPRATVRRYFEEANRVLRPGGRFLFHFRHDDGIGPYSPDIGVDHRGDFSVGWSEAEALAEASLVGWEATAFSDGGGSLFLHGRKP